MQVGAVHQLRTTLSLTGWCPEQLVLLGAWSSLEEHLEGAVLLREWAGGRGEYCEVLRAASAISDAVARVGAGGDAVAVTALARKQLAGMLHVSPGPLLAYIAHACSLPEVYIIDYVRLPPSGAEDSDSQPLNNVSARQTLVPTLLNG